MFFIPGVVISVITFPGVIIHELAHQLFCRLFKVSVFDVCYFRTQNPSGYVIHEAPRKPIHTILIGVGPFFINTIIGALVTLSASIPIIKFKAGLPLDYVLMWLGVSIAMHAFPSTGDAKNILEASKNKDLNIFIRILAKPIVWLIYIFAFGSIAWLDLLFGVGVALFIPSILTSMFV